MTYPDIFSLNDFIKIRTTFKASSSLDDYSHVEGFYRQEKGKQMCEHDKILLLDSVLFFSRQYNLDYSHNTVKCLALRRAINNLFPEKLGNM